MPGLNARCASRLGIVAQGDYEQIGGATKIGRADQIALLPNLPGAVTHGNQVQGRETLLAKEGCEVFTAVDGFDALSKIADHRPDIIFVDIMMPRLDGYQTCSLIKHNKVFRSIPVIMLSSKDGLFDRARGRIVGSEHYLTKPFTRDELLTAIEQHVSGQPPAPK